MKKNISINICGTIYAIDEDAYQEGMRRQPLHTMVTLWRSINSAMSHSPWT